MEEHKDEVTSSREVEDADASENEGEAGISTEILIWSATVFIITIFVVWNAGPPTFQPAGFFAKLFAVILGTVFGVGGVVIGDVARKFARPDAFFSSGMVDTIQTKLFWMLGPQLIGMVIGIRVGIEIVIG